MNVIVILAAILFLLMVIIGGKRSEVFYCVILKFRCSLSHHYFHDRPAYQSDCFNIALFRRDLQHYSFYINGGNVKTVTAFISAMLTIALLLFLLWP